MPATSLSARAERYSPVRYEAFRVCEPLPASKRQPIYPLPLAGPIVTLADALTAALTGGRSVNHKDKLAIRATDEETGEVTLHLYAIKRKSTPRYVYKDYQTRREFDLYADPICTLSGEVLR